MDVRGSRRRSISRGGALLLAVALVAFCVVRLLGSPPAEPIHALPCPERLPLEATAADVWRDPTWVRHQFARACEAVEWACEARFRDRPGIVTGDKAEIAWAAARDDMLARERDPEAEVREPAYYKRFADRLIGVYLPDLHAIYISAAGAEESAERYEEVALISPGMLQLTLVHEAVHALDYEQFPHWHAVARARHGDAYRTFLAVQEGHAQHVVRRIALEWDMEAEWRSMLALWEADPDETDPNAYNLHGPHDLGFRYVCGQRFFDQVHRELGQEGVRTALQHPPRGSSSIRLPYLWIDRVQKNAFERWPPPIPEVIAADVNPRG